MHEQSLPLLGVAKRKRLARPGGRGETPGGRGESLRKPLADDVMKRLIGRALERAIALANTTKQQLSNEMGYPDQSALSRWISGVEPVQFARLWSVESFRPAWVLALAEQTSAVEVVTEIRVRRIA
jgi:hypothetical protein